MVYQAQLHCIFSGDVASWYTYYRFYSVKVGYKYWPALIRLCKELQLVVYNGEFQGRSQDFLHGGWFSTTMIIIIVCTIYIFRLIWSLFGIGLLDFILFVDRKFTYLFTWSWITIYLFKLNSWTFGGVFIMHWSINI